MNQHAPRLQQKCRLCGDDFKKKESTNAKQIYKKGIFELFSIQIEEDIEGVHPNQICSKHVRLLRRYQDASRSGKAYGTEFKPVEFVAHPQSGVCVICTDINKVLETHSYSNEPPHKRQKRAGGPGRGKRSGIIISSDKAESHDGEEKDVHVGSGSVDRIVDDFLQLSNDEQLECLKKLVSSISKNVVEELSHAIGVLQKDAVNEVSKKLFGQYKKLDFLCSINLQEYVSNLNPVIRRMLEGACGCSLGDKNNLVKTGVLHELICKLANQKLVAPLHFLQNIELYVNTSSKKMVNLNGHFGPSGNYDTVKLWLRDQSLDEPITPSGFIVGVFDNDQVVGKTYSIQPANKVKLSIITNRAWIVLDPSSDLQVREDLKPSNWLKWGVVDAKIEALLDCNSAYFLNLEKIHYEQLYYLVDSILQQALKEFSSTKTDRIDTLIENKQNVSEFVVCLNCNLPVSRKKRLCDTPGCGASLREAKKANDASLDSAVPSCSDALKGRRIKFVIDEEYKVSKQLDNSRDVQDERYSHVQTNHPEVPCRIEVADPIFVNPNSYDSVAKVLRKTGMEAGVERYGGNQRKWLVVCCDGQPYSLCVKVIQETRVCKACGKSLFGQKDFMIHMQDECAEKDQGFYFEFDWVLLKIGGGHYEMNMVRSFFELNWIPFLSDMCRLMGFKSEAAQKYAKKCGDNHKAWQLLLVFHLGSLFELVILFLKESLCVNPTAADFFKFMKGKSDSRSLMYFLEQVCCYSQSILNFRMGIRRNNYQLVCSAKHEFKGIFHARNHDKYQLIELHDSFKLLTCPSDLQAVICNHESISKSGDKSKGQDFDFVLEEINRQTKRWMPRGVPSDLTWLTVCRNLDKLQKLEKQNEELFQFCDSSNATRHLELTPAIDAWRMKLRETKYLEKVDTFCSISGKELDQNLCNITEVATARRNYLIHSFFSKDESLHVEDELLHPVYVTPEEHQAYNDISAQTVPNIASRISEIITSFEDLDLQTMYTNRFKREVSGKTKAIHVRFHDELLSVLEDLEGSPDDTYDFDES